MNGERIVGIFVISERTGALDTHHHQERIQSRQILSERLVEIILARREIPATYQLIFSILLLRIMSPVIRINIIIDSILRKLRMQLARLSVQTKSAIIVNPIRNVRRLLNLRYETTATDGMYTAGRKEKHIPGIDLKPGENIGDGVVPDPLDILLWGDFLGETGQQVRALVGTHDIPHLGLALGVMALLGQFVVRMDLNGEILLSVNEFNQKRKLVAGIGVDLLADELTLVFLHEFSDGHAFELAVRDDGFMSLHAGKFPTFTYIMLICNDFLIRSDFLATPYYSFEYGFKF